jgi:serine/threonine-protein kinase RsbW
MVKDTSRWVCSVRSVADAGRAVNAVARAMGDAGYGPGDLFAVRLALGEAVTNALKHGNGGDPTKQVRVSFDITPGRVFAEVQDEGAGFDPEAIPDPRVPDNLERPGGRGLFLMRHYMSWVSYSERGNRVLLCKDRSGVSTDG